MIESSGHGGGGHGIPADIDAVRATHDAERIEHARRIPGEVSPFDRQIVDEAYDLTYRHRDLSSRGAGSRAHRDRCDEQIVGAGVKLRIGRGNVCPALHEYVQSSVADVSARMDSAPRVPGWDAESTTAYRLRTSSSGRMRY
jgi:hypothetical protein